MGFVVTVGIREEQERHWGDLRSPEEHGARLAPEQKGAQGDSIPLGQATPSAQKEDTRSLSMVQSPY